MQIGYELEIVGGHPTVGEDDHRGPEPERVNEGDADLVRHAGRLDHLVKARAGAHVAAGLGGDRRDRRAPSRQLFEAVHVGPAILVGSR